jgi:hypothetical protein
MSEASRTRTTKLPLTVVMVVRDEEVNLPDCLHSVCGWAE